DVAASLATVDELMAEQKFGRANALLDTLQPHLATDPQLAARAADLRDRVATEQLVVAAEAARLDENFGEAKDLYRQVLMRDPNSQPAIAKLSELQAAVEKPELATAGGKAPAPRAERAERAERPAKKAPQAAEHGEPPPTSKPPRSN